MLTSGRNPGAKYLCSRSDRSTVLTIPRSQVFQKFVLLWRVCKPNIFTRACQYLLVFARPHLAKKPRPTLRLHRIAKLRDLTVSYHLHSVDSWSFNPLESCALSPESNRFPIPNPRLE